MAMTARDLLAAARRVVPEVGAEAVHARLARGGHVLIDVRERGEYEAGHLPGAIHISKSYIEVLLEERVPDRQTPITLYCAGGTRSLRPGHVLMCDADRPFARGFARAPVSRLGDSRDRLWQAAGGCLSGRRGEGRGGIRRSASSDA